VARKEEGRDPGGGRGLGGERSEGNRQAWRPLTGVRGGGEMVGMRDKDEGGSGQPRKRRVGGIGTMSRGGVGTVREAGREERIAQRLRQSHLTHGLRRMCQERYMGQRAKRKERRGAEPI
jgi:hypothetical protein